MSTCFRCNDTGLYWGYSPITKQNQQLGCYCAKGMAAMDPKEIMRDILAAVECEDAGTLESPHMYIWSSKWKPLKERIESYLKEDEVTLKTADVKELVNALSNISTNLQATAIDLARKLGNLKAAYDAHPTAPLVSAEYNAWLLRLGKAIGELKEEG